MTLQEIDEALLAWNNRLAAVAADLLALQGDSTYKFLTGSGGGAKAQLTGATAARVEPALATMAGVFERFTLLNATMEKAAKLRTGLPALFGADAKLREIEQLLVGRSIGLPGPDVPLDGRSLAISSADPQRATPNEVLQTIMQVFAAVRDVVLALAAAWEALGTAIADEEGRRDRLAAQYLTLRAAPAMEVAELGGIFDVLKARVQADPLGAQGDLRARVEPLLNRMAKQVEAAERLRNEVLEARVQLETLRGMHHETRGALREACAKIAGCEALPGGIPDEKLASLSEWLDRLDRKRVDNPLDAVAVGLRNWTRAADTCAGEESTAYASARRPLEARAELRGRLDALKAKARMYGVAEQDAAKALAQAAEALLYTQPTALPEATKAVARYEDALTHAGAPIRKEDRKGVGRP